MSEGDRPEGIPTEFLKPHSRQFPSGDDIYVEMLVTDLVEISTKDEYNFELYIPP